MHPQLFVTSSFNDSPVEKWEFSPAPASTITHEYFSGVWGMCHRGGRRLTGSALYPHHHPMMLELLQKPIPRTSQAQQVWSCQPSQWLEYIGYMLWRVIGNFIHSEKGSKIIPTCRVGLSTLAVILRLIFSIPRCLMSLIRKQLQMEKHINTWAQIVLDAFQLALDVLGITDLVTQHIFHT